MLAQASDEKEQRKTGHFYDLDDCFWSWARCFPLAKEAELNVVLAAHPDWDRAAFLAQVREVHVEWKDTEFAPSVRYTALWQAWEKDSPAEADALFSQARAAFDEMTTQHLRLFDGTTEMMDGLKAHRRQARAEGIEYKIVAITDGCTKAAFERMKALGMLEGPDPFFDKIYCREEPDNMYIKRTDWFDEKYAHLFVERPRTHKKCDYNLLSPAMAELGFDPAVHKVYYSGDSSSSDTTQGRVSGVRMMLFKPGGECWTPELLDILRPINGYAPAEQAWRSKMKGLKQPGPHAEVRNFSHDYLPHFLSIEPGGGVLERAHTPLPERKAAFEERKAAQHSEFIEVMGKDLPHSPMRCPPKPG